MVKCLACQREVEGPATSLLRIIEQLEIATNLDGDDLYEIAGNIGPLCDECQALWEQAVWPAPPTENG